MVQHLLKQLKGKGLYLKPYKKGGGKMRQKKKKKKEEKSIDSIPISIKKEGVEYFDDYAILDHQSN